MSQLVCNLSGIEHRDALVIQSMLRLFERKLETPWACTSATGDKCDVLLVDVDGDAGRMRRQPSAAGASVSVAFTSQDSAPYHWVLKKPLRSQSIVALFNDLSVWLRPKEDARDQGTQARGDSNWSTDSNLLSAVESAARIDKPAVVRCSDLTWIAIHPAEKIFVSTMGLHTIFQELTPEPVHVHLTTDWEFAKGMIPNGNTRAPRGLNELLWVAHLRGASILQTNSARPEQMVKLSRWPNFTSLPHSPQHLRLAAMLTNREMSLDQASKLTSVPLDEVTLFVNACKAVGLFVPVKHNPGSSLNIPAFTPPPAPQQQKRAGILRGLLNRLGILQ